jgi:predicted O-methyltransferase YrrM
LESKTELVLEENASKEAKKTKNTRSEMDPKYAEEAKVFFSDIGFAERLVEEALKEQE